MSKALITLTFRQHIHAYSEEPFEKNVFHYSYEEFLLKSQAYNTDGLLNTFTQLKQRDGRANSLHYKTGFAIDGFIAQLHKQMPVIKTTLGAAVAFDSYRTELIESNNKNKDEHQLAIYYTSGVLSLLAITGEYLVLATGDQLTGYTTAAVPTFMIRMQDGLAIESWQDADLPAGLKTELQEHVQHIL